MITKGQILGDVKKIFESTLKLPSGKLEGDERFEDIGIDSFISVELIDKVSKRFDISISPTKFANVSTIGEMVEMLEVEINDQKENHSLEKQSRSPLTEVSTNYLITKGQILDDVKKIFESTLKLPSGKLEGDERFEDIGIDSFISVELIDKVSKRFDISISPTKFANVSTIEEMVEMLEMEINGQKENRPLEKQSPSVGKTISTKDSYQELLHYINNEYGIDLSTRSFTSVDEIIDTLVTNHSDDLLFKLEESDLKDNEKEFLTNQVGDIAIVGISCNFPDAPNSHSFWNNLINQKNSICEIPQSRWDVEKFYAESVTPGKTNSKWGALINDIDCFDPDFFGIDPQEAHLIDPQERLMMQEVYKAFQDGGIDPSKLRGTSTGVFMSYEYSEYERYIRKNIDKIPISQYGPIYSSSSPTYYLANRLSFVFDFHGPSESINVNCAGSAVAINRAYYSLINNESSVAIVGGTSLNLFEDDYIILSQFGIFSPNGTCAVFDDNANGFSRGEGVAAIILKRLSDAQRDNNKIYGVIKSIHQNNRGKARSLSEIKHESITNVIRDCYKKVSVEPNTVRYIEVDGYATKWADSFEYEGIKNVFKSTESTGKNCALGSLKGNIGNLESVNGLAGVIKLALSLYNKKIPATISKKKINSFIDIEKMSHPLYIADSPISFESIREKDNSPIRVGINSFADSGVNIHILLEEYNSTSIESNKRAVFPHLFILSAKDIDRLKCSVNEYIDYMLLPNKGAFIDMIYTLQTGRQEMDERLAVLASSYEEVLEKLNLFLDYPIDKASDLENRGIFYGNIEQANHNPLLSLFTEDMVRKLFEQSFHNQQWQQIAQLWINGLSLDWEIIWSEKPVQPITLPLYPFNKEKYWVKVNENAESIKTVMAKAIIAPQKEDCLQQYQWHFSISDGTKDTGSMNPREKIELFLKQEVAKQLQVPIQEISTKKSFVELGIASIGILILAQKINELLKEEFSLNLFFKYNDIQKITEYLLESYKEKINTIIINGPDEKLKFPSNEVNNLPINDMPSDERIVKETIIVSLQIKGDYNPIFALPGADGRAVSLLQLSLALGDKQPFYALETPVLNSVEEIAKANIDAIKTVKPVGPYCLLGYSNGGIIAYEMTKVLQEQGEIVASLIMLDTPCPLQSCDETPDPLDLIVNVCESIANTLNFNLELDIKQLQSIPENERGEYIYNILKNNGLDLAREQFVSDFNNSLTISMNNEHCCRVYKPSKLLKKTDVLLFRTNEGYKGASDDYGWNELLLNPISIYRFNTSHFDMINEEFAQKIAKKIVNKIK